MNTKNRIDPQVFALWLACASILMMFFAFTSAFIVKKAGGSWLDFPMPSIFLLSTIVVLLSSVTLQASFWAFGKGRETLYKSLLVVTAILGVAFLIVQYYGWLQLESMGIYLDGNPSGSFVYVITWVHAAHLLGGLAAIIVAIIYAFMLPFKVTKKRKHRFRLTLTYWHFVDFLWVYLLIFLMSQN